MYAIGVALAVYLLFTGEEEKDLGDYSAAKIKLVASETNSSYLEVFLQCCSGYGQFSMIDNTVP